MTSANDMPRRAKLILALLDTPTVHAAALRGFIKKRDAGGGADECIAAAMAAAKDEIARWLEQPVSKDGTP